jgi:hypothetical protein
LRNRPIILRPRVIFQLKNDKFFKKKLKNYFFFILKKMGV